MAQAGWSAGAGVLHHRGGIAITGQLVQGLAPGIRCPQAATYQLPRPSPLSREPAARAGVPVLTVSRRLGHAKASQTLDTYAHLQPGADADAAKAIEGVLTLDVKERTR